MPRFGAASESSAVFAVRLLEPMASCLLFASGAGNRLGPRHIPPPQNDCLIMPIFSKADTLFP